MNLTFRGKNTFASTRLDKRKMMSLELHIALTFWYARYFRKAIQFVRSYIRHFSLKNDGFFKKMLEDAKLMPDMYLLKISRRYLPPFLSYRENPGRGRICSHQRGTC